MQSDLCKSENHKNEISAYINIKSQFKFHIKNKH